MGLRSAYCSAAPRHKPNSIRLRRQTGLCLFVRHHVGRPTTVVAEISLRSHPLHSAGMLTALWHVGTYRPPRQFPQSSDTFHYSTFHTVSVRGLVTTDETRRNCLQIFWTSSAGKFSVELSSRTQLRPSTRRDGLVASRCSWRCELTATASYLHSSSALSLVHSAWTEQDWSPRLQFAVSKLEYANSEFSVSFEHSCSALEFNSVPVLWTTL